MSFHWGDNDECEFKAIKKEISLAHRRLKLLKRSSKAAGRIAALEGNIKFHSARANSISTKISELSSVTVAFRRCLCLVPTFYRALTISSLILLNQLFIREIREIRYSC